MAILRSLKRHIDDQLTELARQHNDLVPINKLPEEVSADILRYAIPSQELDIGSLQNLAGVQIRWRDIIKNRASFWTTLHSESPTNITILKLDRSQNAPLNINCVTSHADIDALEKYMDQVAPHRDRWRSFTHKGPHFRIIEDQLSHPLPTLEHLELLPCNDEEGYRGTLFGIVPGGSQLRSIVLSNVMVSFSDLSNLSSVTIRGVADSLLLSNHLIDLLTAAPQLWSLSLSDVGANHRGFGHGRRVGVPECVPLTTLAFKHLDIESESIALIDLLLRIIPISQDTYLSLRVHSYEVDSKQLLNKLLQPREVGQWTLPSLLSRTTREPIEVSVQSRSFFISVGGSFRISIGFHQLSWLQMLPKLQSFELGPRAVILRNTDMEGDDLDADFFLLWPNVVKFVLFSNKSQARQIMSRLAEPQDGAWLWPNLSSVIFPSLFWFIMQREEIISLKRQLFELVDIRTNEAATAVSSRLGIPGMSLTHHQPGSTRIR